MTASPRPTVVLIHGGFVDGSGWRGVYDRLRAAGHRVAVVQNPTVSLEGDVAATKQVLDDIDGHAVLVGHSYGGVVITETGSDHRVAGLVYIAAFAPDKGESVNTLIADPPPGAPVPPILPPRDGYLFLDRDKFHDSFAGDLPADEAAFMADSQVPWGVDALGGTVTEPGVAAQAELVPRRQRRPDDPAAGPARHGRTHRRLGPRGRRQPLGLRLAAAGRRRPDPRRGRVPVAALTRDPKGPRPPSLTPKEYP